MQAVLRGTGWFLVGGTKGDHSLSHAPVHLNEEEFSASVSPPERDLRSGINTDDSEKNQFGWEFFHFPL